jgi:predicted enzyme related to lactoylglutathione lyase
MSRKQGFPPNTFCWIELGTTDAAAAKSFYGELLGWTFNDMPAGPDMVYTMTQRDGTTATGLYQLTEEMKSQGIPPNWLSYVSVANVDETAAKAKSLGATIAKEPFDVMEVGRMAVIEDPTGAVFALWQAKPPQEMHRQGRQVLHGTVQLEQRNRRHGRHAVHEFQER